MKPCVYRYVVNWDAGTAPNPFGGWCTLAICKPRIRKAAERGDWIIGFRKRRNDHVVYVMEVEGSLSFAEYWGDKRFSNRRPGRTQFPDNLYRPNGAGGFEQIANRVHGPECAKGDLGGQRVLISRRFWYFGEESPPIPTELAHLVHSTQGHVVHRRRRDDDIAQLGAWLQLWEPGAIGNPIDAPRDILGKPVKTRGDCRSPRPRTTC